MCTLIVSNEINQIFSHDAASYMLNGRHVRIYSRAIESILVQSKTVTVLLFLNFYILI